MGKITLNGKDITKPFDFNGKKVVSITVNGKVCTLQDTAVGSTCGVMEHTFPNGFAYSGTWPRDYNARNALEALKSATVDTYARFVSIGSSVTAIRWPFKRGEIRYSHLICMEVLSEIIERGFLAYDDYTLKSVYLPNATEIGIANFTRYHQLTTLIAPKVERIQSSIDDIKAESLDFPELKDVSSSITNCSKLKSLKIPKCTEFRGTINSPLTYLDMHSLISTRYFSLGRDFTVQGIINAATTTVVLNNRYEHSDSIKDQIFGKGNWENITFQYI